MKAYIKILCCLSTLVLCQCSSDAPPPQGTLRNTYPGVQKNMALAKQAEGKKDAKGAIKRYKTIAEDYELAVEAPYARLRMGQLREQLNDYIDAFDEYQKLIERYPASPYYAEALRRQRELAFNAASGKLGNKVLWMFNVSMDPAIVVKWLNSVVDNAPFSSSAAEAKKILGDYQAKRGNLGEAIMAYQSVVDNYGNSKYAPACQLRVADLYSRIRQDGDRSFTNITKAQEAYEEFILRYPGHPDIGKARQGLAAVRKQMVQNKLDVGEYYMDKMHDYSAAKFCFEEVIAARKTNPQAAAVADRHLARIAKILKK